METNESIVGVRYIVHDAEIAVDFYTKFLGFTINMQAGPAYADIQRGNLRIFMNQPGAGAAGQAMPDGTLPAPGGWNRIRIVVKDLEDMVNRLKKEGAVFRNDIITGAGGKQVLLMDPSGNLIELFEPAG